MRKTQNQDNNTPKAFVLAGRNDAAESNLLPVTGEELKTSNNSLMFQEFGFIFGKCEAGKILLQFVVYFRA